MSCYQGELCNRFARAGHLVYFSDVSSRESRAGRSTGFQFSTHPFKICVTVFTGEPGVANHLHEPMFIQSKEPIIQHGTGLYFLHWKGSGKSRTQTGNVCWNEYEKYERNLDACVVIYTPWIFISATFNAFLSFAIETGDVYNCSSAGGSNMGEMGLIVWILDPALATVLFRLCQLATRQPKRKSPPHTLLLSITANLRIFLLIMQAFICAIS